jgi:hypothetical protein
VIVSADAKLVDLRTGELLWQGHAQASSAENQNNGGGGLLGMLVAAAVNQIVNQVTDEGHQIANAASVRLLSAGHPMGCFTDPTIRSTNRRNKRGRLSLVPTGE